MNARKAGAHFRKTTPLLLGVLLGASFFSLAGCSSSSGFSGATTPLPTGQTGSLAALAAAPGNCYVSDSLPCSPSAASTGSKGITALATVTYGSSNALFLGDSNGDVYEAPVGGASTLPSPSHCIAAGSGSKILSLALIPTSTSPGTLFYATSSGVSTAAVTSSCGLTTGTPITTVTTPSLLAYNPSATVVIGATTAGTFFSCTITPTPSCTSRGSLPNFPGGATVKAIASDPQYAVVYVVTDSNGSDAISFYSVGSGGSSLTFIGSYTGSELNVPVAVSLFHGANPTQNTCTSTTGGCNFMDVANGGNSSITQYVLTYSFSNGTPTGVSLTQFNAAYLECDIINPTSIAAISSPTSGAPAVFAGENGTSFGECLGVTAGTPFGNNVTAYTATGE